MGRTSLLLMVLAANLVLGRCWKASSGVHVPLHDASNNAPSASAHRIRLDANYDVFWSTSETDITFEVQVRTLGYVMFGLSPSGLFQDADLVVGWVQNGRPRFQVRRSLSTLSLRFH